MKKWTEKIKKELDDVVCISYSSINEKYLARIGLALIVHIERLEGAIERLQLFKMKLIAEIEQLEAIADKARAYRQAEQNICSHDGDDWVPVKPIDETRMELDRALVAVYNKVADEKT